MTKFDYIVIVVIFALLGAVLAFDLWVKRQDPDQ